MGEPIFKSNYIPDFIPSTSEFISISKEIEISDDLIDNIYYCLLVNGAPGIEIVSNIRWELPNWSDYYEFKGDSTVIYYGQLSGNVYLGSYVLANPLDRAKYYKYIAPYNYAYWDSGLEYNIRVTGTVSGYIPVPPTKENSALLPGYPSYPTAPYNQLSMTLNVPDAEYTPDLGNDSAFMQKGLIKIASNKYMIKIEGYSFIQKLPSISNISQTYTQKTLIYDVEYYEEIRGDYRYRGFRYNLTSSTSSSFIKRKYNRVLTPKPEINYKLLVGIKNNKNFKERNI